jgi:hypothetical protein
MGQSVDELLAQAIELSLQQFDEPTNGRPVTDWSDQQVVAAANLELPVVADRRLSELLDRQQAGSLLETERPELASLMELYQRRLVQKAQALREAVRRGLLEPLPS